MFASVGNQQGYHLYFLDVESFCFHHQMFTMLLLCIHQIRLLDWEKYYLATDLPTYGYGPAVPSCIGSVPSRALALEQYVLALYRCIERYHLFLVVVMIFISAKKSKPLTPFIIFTSCIKSKSLELELLCYDAPSV